MEFMEGNCEQVRWGTVTILEVRPNEGPAGRKDTESETKVKDLRVKMNEKLEFQVDSHDTPDAAAAGNIFSVAKLNWRMLL